MGILGIVIKAGDGVVVVSKSSSSYPDDEIGVLIFISTLLCSSKSGAGVKCNSVMSVSTVVPGSTAEVSISIRVLVSTCCSLLIKRMPLASSSGMDSLLAIDSFDFDLDFLDPCGEGRKKASCSASEKLARALISLSSALTFTRFQILALASRNWGFGRGIFGSA